MPEACLERIEGGKAPLTGPKTDCGHAFEPPILPALQERNGGEGTSLARAVHVENDRDCRERLRCKRKWIEAGERTEGLKPRGDIRRRIRVERSAPAFVPRIECLEELRGCLRLGIRRR